MHVVLSTVALFAAGVAGGAINAVAGGGSFIVFPALVLGGVAPVTANATTAAALWPAGLASTGAYRDFLWTRDGDKAGSSDRSRSTLITLAAMSLLGGGVGARLLLVTSDALFSRILPGLMLAAAVIFTFGPRFTRRTGKATVPLVLGAIVQLAIATYGGYFGGGMGIMMLATFTLMGMRHMHEMNALKVILGLLINGVATIAFFAARKVVIAIAVPVALGSIVGGWAGADLARRVEPRRVRRLVLVFAWSLTLWFFYRALRR